MKLLQSGLLAFEMMTSSAMSFLATTANKPVSLMINQFEAQMQLECAAVASLAILGVNLVIKGVVFVVKAVEGKREAKVAAAAVVGE